MEFLLSGPWIKATKSTLMLAFTMMGIMGITTWLCFMGHQSIKISKGLLSLHSKLCIKRFLFANQVIFQKLTQELLSIMLEKYWKSLRNSTTFTSWMIFQATVSDTCFTCLPWFYIDTTQHCQTLCSLETYSQSNQFLLWIHIHLQSCGGTILQSSVPTIPMLNFSIRFL